MQKYSIILPVRNGGEYVKECIGSILSQTFSHFNLIVLENGSTDGTAEWLSSLADPRIIIYPSAQSLSIEENWRRILDVPKNEFITLIGHDDVLLPGYLQTMDELIRQNPHAGLYQTHSVFIDATGQKIRDCLPMPARMSAEDFLHTTLQLELDLSGTGFMCRARDYDTVGGIPLFPKLMFSDYILWFSLIGNRDVAVSPDISFQYRLHQNTSQTADPIVYSDALLRFIHSLEVIARENKELKATIQKYAPVFIASYAKSICHKLLRYPLKKRNGLTVSAFLMKVRAAANGLSAKKQMRGISNADLLLPVIIDSNEITRNIFRRFRKIYKGG